MAGIELREYQRLILEKFKYMASCALFLGTGSGKTIVSLTKAMQSDTKHLLVICPSKVVFQWINVINELFPKWDVIEVKKSQSSQKRLDNILKADYSKPRAIVVSIESMRLMLPLKNIVSSEWTIIVDESHKIKEIGTVKKPVLATQAVLSLATLTDNKMILTATPTQKEFGGYIDYYTQLSFLGYVEGSYNQFKQRYCKTKKIQPQGLPFPIEVIVGYNSCISEIDNLLEQVAVRYVPKFNDFEPELIKVLIPKPPSYKKLSRERYYEDLDLTSNPRMRLAKQSICTGTVMGKTIYDEDLTYDDNDYKEQWLDEFISNADGRVVVFYNLNVELERLKALCTRLSKKFIVINGNTSPEDKVNLVKGDDWDICLGQFSACGESIDGLQYKSHLCVFFAIPNSSVIFTQAKGRIDRIGQEFAPMYYFMCCEGTVEEKVYNLLKEKIEYSEEVLNKLYLKEGEN